MFKKETTFCGMSIGDMFPRGVIRGVYLPEFVRRMAEQIANCHAEIDRLNAELAALRSQQVERVWISSETHDRFPESGVYFVRTKTGFESSGVKSVNDVPTNGYDYTLILAEADFPVPPKPESEPLEVKVGKYRFGNGDTAEIYHIDQYGNCAYQFHAMDASMMMIKKDEAQAVFKRNNAVFIGEGDNQ